MTLKKLFTLSALSTVIALPGVAAADYPERPVEFIVPWGPGGASDLLMRLIGQHLSEELGKPVPIINMPGASGTVGLREASRRAPDGYSISQIHEGLLIAHHAGVTDQNWDAFEPVAMMTSDDIVVLANADTGWETLDDMLEAVQPSPGDYRMGVTLGGIPHLWAVQFEDATDTEFGYVGYEGTGERLRALAGGHITLSIEDYHSAEAFVENGDINVLAAATEERLEELPDVPTLKELGYDLEFLVTRGIVVPKDTPEAVIERLETALATIAESEAFQGDIANVGSSVRFMDRAAYTDYLERTDALIEENAHLLD
ncbi:MULTISPECIES: tripartite tricarboxylate transporter substrate binding protein [unclassified Halomonas]|uniref:tripartite tricarboxylate transporter substrate binding protein n=1 Tax=unclassified Halomonas TaxID=2609666 RepID=UPI00209F560E|nr:MULTISPECIES: tripartite tricarboxylate transporter substrate binding protein [unclassified Halomonas]MCP1315005.1 tripartite tricarboxylate transporter substrate binding protein [Halomonas sp. 707D7]MCP1326582.1 tripartite tricarboxylate transporter substrate binding protein [Halomonas sp. 707D4]